MRAPRIYESGYSCIVVPRIRNATTDETFCTAMDIRQLFDDSDNVEQFQAGDVIFREGDQAHHMYVVLQGDIELRVADRAVGQCRAGDIMGEMAIVGSHKRTATAVAISACRLVPVTERRFVLLVQEQPYFALHVMKILTDRIVRKEHEMHTGVP